MSKWLEAKKIKGKFYIDSSDFSNIVKEYSDKIDELEEENRNLKDKIEFLTNCLDDRDKSIAILQEENKGLKADYIKLSKIVETTGGYKASYVNKLRDEIAKLEIYKKQYKHSMGEDYIEEDLYDLDC